MKADIFAFQEKIMKTAAKISAVLASFILAFSILGCKNDSDDEQSYLIEGGIISKSVYDSFRYYSNSEIEKCRSECLVHSISGSYKKESVDEDDLSSDLDFLTDSQIQWIKENYETIMFFETNDSNQYLWLYTRKE